MKLRSFLKAGLFTVFAPAIIKPTWSQVLLVNEIPKGTPLYPLDDEFRGIVFNPDEFMKADCDRIIGRIARSLALNSPWMNVIEDYRFPFSTPSSS